MPQRVGHLDALYQLTAALSRADAVAEIYEAALRGLQRALQLDRASILLFDPDGVMRFKAWRGLSAQYRRATEGHTPWPPDAEDPQLVLVPDVDAEPTLAALRNVIRAEGIRALAFVPLVHHGRLLGKFMLYYPTPHQFGEDEIQLAQSISDHIAVAVARNQSEQVQAFLVNASTLLASSLDYEATLRHVARIAVPTMADWCFVGMLDADGTVRELVIAHDDPAAEARARQLLRQSPPDAAASIGIAAAVRAGQSQLVPIIPEEARPVAPDNPASRALNDVIAGRSSMCVPLLVRGAAIGAISFMMGRSRRRFAEVDLLVAEELAQHAARAIDNARLYQDAQAARTAANIAAERAAFLAEISQLLASSLDYAEILSSLAHATVPFFADACIMYQLAAPTTLRRVALAHADPDMERQLREVQRFEIPLESDIPVARVVRTGKTEVANQLEETIGEQVHGDPTYQAIVRRFAPQAFVCVPLTARERRLGAVAFVVTTPHRHYTAADVGFAEEVARRAALALDNARLYQEAQDAIQVRDRFLSTAAHELKTPLTSLLGNAQLMERRAKRESSLSERDLRAVHVIKVQAERLSKMIAALLDISRLELGKLSVERAPVDLCALARRAVEELQPGLTIHTVTCTSADDPIVIEGDELRLEQVLQNLLSNAVKYSPNGGAVQVGVERQGDAACITVRDQGMGIPDADQPHLFERFYRARNTDTRHVTGMGIGLYIVKEIVALHGGAVTVESREGQGSTFVVCLPLRGDIDQERRPEISSEPLIGDA